MRLTIFICTMLLSGIQVFAQSANDSMPIKRHIDTSFTIKGHNGQDTLVRFTSEVNLTRTTVNELKSSFSRLAGQYASDFYVHDQSGKEVALHNFFGKVVFLNCWFTGSKPSLDNIKYLKLVNEFFQHNESIAIVNVCIDKKKNHSKWKQLIKQDSIPGFNLFMDEEETKANNAVYSRSVATEYPTYVVISKDGRFLGVAPEADNPAVLYVLKNAEQDASTLNSFLQQINFTSSYVQFNKDYYFPLADYVTKWQTLKSKDASLLGKRKRK